jgi:hypothetical protein
MDVSAWRALTYIPMPFQPKADNLTVGVAAKGGRAIFNSLQVHELKSAWESPYHRHTLSEGKT